MVAVLLILDGASEPLGSGPTSLELARTPTLDRLTRGGTLTRLQTIPDGLPAGSDTAIPGLLGWTPTSGVDRGLLEAAAHEVPLADGDHAWRVDVVDGDGNRADEPDVQAAEVELRSRLHRHMVRRIGGHRLLLSGPPPLPIARQPNLRLWPEGVAPPGILDRKTVVVCARGAAAGTARLMGADVIVPPGATGWIDTDLTAKATAAAQAIATGARQVVVHVAAPDEAAHRLDRATKIAAIERIDRDLVAPLLAAVRSASGTLTICPDHGCDPCTGLHCSDPVPRLTWPSRSHHLDPTSRVTERAVADLPIISLACREAA